MLCIRYFYHRLQAEVCVRTFVRIIHLVSKVKAIIPWLLTFIMGQIFSLSWLNKKQGSQEKTFHPNDLESGTTKSEKSDAALERNDSVCCLFTGSKRMVKEATSTPPTSNNMEKNDVNCQAKPESPHQNHTNETCISINELAESESNDQNQRPEQNEEKAREQVPSWASYAKEQKLQAYENDQYKRNKMLNHIVALFFGDITQLHVDVIVNAANSSLRGGGGVDGAIHAAAGPRLAEDAGRFAPCETGNAVITPGHHLFAQHVIHAVGPMREQPAQLKSCYEKALQLAVDNKLTSIAFPCISTGIYGYPNKKAAPLVLGSVRRWLEKDDNALKMKRIVFCVYLPEDLEIYRKNMCKIFPVSLDGKDDESPRHHL